MPASTKHEIGADSCVQRFTPAVRDRSRTHAVSDVAVRCLFRRTSLPETRDRRPQHHVQRMYVVYPPEGPRPPTNNEELYEHMRRMQERQGSSAASGKGGRGDA